MAQKAANFLEENEVYIAQDKFPIFWLGGPVMPISEGKASPFSYKAYSGWRQAPSNTL